MTASRPYRPANGTEGEIFMGQWCARCEHCDTQEGYDCSIVQAAFVFQVHEPEYPVEWVYQDGAAVCLAFAHKAAEDGTEPPFRCHKTPDMFGGGI